MQINRTKNEYFCESDVAEQKKPLGEIDRMTQLVSDLQSDLRSIRANLCHTADRIMGEEPQDDEGQCGFGSSMSGEVGSLEIAIRNAHDLASEIQEISNRLGRL